MDPIATLDEIIRLAQEAKDIWSGKTELRSGSIQAACWDRADDIRDAATDLSVFFERG